MLSQRLDAAGGGGARSPAAGRASVGWGLLSLAAFAGGLALAAQHPLWAIPAMALFVVWSAVAALRSAAWWWVAPLCLPWLNFAPWTGGLLVEEFDLVLLGAIAGGYLSLARGLLRGARWRSAEQGVFAAVAISLVVSTLRGWLDAGGGQVGWFDLYSGAANTLRVAKSLAFALAFWPIVRSVPRDGRGASSRKFVTGMQVGLVVVCLAALWERAAIPGLLNFSSTYRTTALFWEMHVGGAAIDAYLAMAAPFAAWAVWTARTPQAFVVASAFALCVGYTCLTTFSRGVYLGVALPLLVLGVNGWLVRHGVDRRTAWRRMAVGFAGITIATLALLGGLALHGLVGVAVAVLPLAVLLAALFWPGWSIRWRKAAVCALALALLTEVVVVIGGGAFMRARIASSDSDFGSRTAHWARGIALLSSPADWAWGIGMGRLPDHYVQSPSGAEFPGKVERISVDAGAHGLRLFGPATDARLEGLYSATQRMHLEPGVEYRVEMTVLARVAVDLDVSICEKHLLYARRCQVAYVQVAPKPQEWQRIGLMLKGRSLGAGASRVPASGVLSMAVSQAGAALDIAHVSVLGRHGAEQLVNRDFADGLAHWFPVARAYFLPWHIDSLPLELLIERGLVALLLAAGVGWCALGRLASAAERGDRIAPFIAAALLGAALVGAVSSILDVPRVAFLLFLMTMVALSGGLDHGSS